ncbi:MAG: ABC transporter permease, partial [Alphaproteobacteria bacterium]|nr:ABC transporter permease [Alphaproteobacteria bacterium]
GVYLSFRVLDFPDLTADGSFPLGAAIAATMIVAGMNPWLATLIAFFGGTLAGIVTAYLNVRFGILSLLASILTMTALYSINIRIMDRPNIAMLYEETVFTSFESFFGDHNVAVLVFGFAAVFIIGFVVYWLLQSQIGLAIRATGANPVMAQAQGVKTKSMILLGIALSNGIIAFAGALFAQSQGFADVNMGVGTIIIGLASVIIGEVILPPRLVIFSIIGCIIGSILYRLAIAFALNADFMKPSDLNLMTALIVVLAMILPKLKKEAASKIRRS